MCTISMVSDDWAKRLPDNWPNIVPPQWSPNQQNALTFELTRVSRQEFEALKKEVEAMKELLKAAKKYDEATGQPDCEVEDKVALIKQIAKLVGVDMREVFPEAE